MSIAWPSKQLEFLFASRLFRGRLSRLFVVVLFDLRPEVKELDPFVFQICDLREATTVLHQDVALEIEDGEHRVLHDVGRVHELGDLERDVGVIEARELPERREAVLGVPRTDPSGLDDMGCQG